MHVELTELARKGEEHYLQRPELIIFRHHATNLAKRLQTYEILRDQEVNIFQPVADQLEKNFANTPPQSLEKALRHWIAVLRYASMAMLINNPDYFRHRLLEWLTDQVQAYNIDQVEIAIAEYLQDSLKKYLSENQMAFIKPYIEQTLTTFTPAQASEQPSEPALTAN